MFFLAAAFSAFSHAETLKPAPDFTLVSTGGEKISLSKLRGRVVLINFFAEWCVPCRKEIPHLNQWHKKYAPDLMVLGIDYDNTKKEKVAALKKEMGIAFTCLIDSKKLVQKGYKLFALPVSFLIDADGNLISRVEGGITDERVETVEGKIKELLEEVSARKNALLVSVSEFENLTEKAKKEKMAGKIQAAVTQFLTSQEGIALSEKPVLRIEGEVSMFTDEAGVEIKIVEAATGNVLDTLSMVVTGDDFSALLDEILEKLKASSNL